MKTTIKFCEKFVLFFFLIIFSILSIINIPWMFVSKQTSSTDYSNWMSENITSDKKIVDIAMIGAHDAFSYQIDIFSQVDEKSAESVMTGFVGKFIKGFSIRQSKTQTVNVEEQLKSGVRYFDMRLSYNEDEKEYYTVHNYFSTPLKSVLRMIEKFLSANPGEFIILDIQHVYGVDYNSQEDFIEVYNYFEEEKLTDYAYPNNIKSLSSVSYADVTDDKNQGGIMVFSKFSQTNEYFWGYDAHIRSSWANEDEFDKIIDFLESEKTDIILNMTYRDRLVVMQAVATMEMSTAGIFRSFGNWSLLGRAREFNQYLLNYEGIDLLLDVMPIMMVDYASDKETVDQMMELIIEHNS
ncbi:MAG: phosphatidylinositol-specific phospholipase C domain-containing protein [Candidatus Izemoplasmatales bacterium]